MSRRLGQPLRITFVLPDFGRTGGSRVVAIHARNLQARGHDVTVVGRPIPEQSLRVKLGSLARGRGWPSNRHGGTYFDDLPVRRHVIDSIRPITEADVPDADVIVATWWETAEWIASMPPRKGAHAYFLQHDEPSFADNVARAEATWRLPMHKIAVARWLVDLVHQRCGADEDVTLVANSVDTKQFHASPRGKQAAPTVGLMYTRTPFKGVDISLAAFREAARDVPGLRLVAFGHRAEWPDLPLPARAQMTVAPAQDSIREIYAACDAWLFGSRSEGFGLPILEAFACRTPVIATPAGAAPELLSSGGGILVKREDASDMARAIREIAAMSDAKWRAMSDAAYAEAHRYTWDDATDLFEAALYHTVSAPSPSTLGEGWGEGQPAIARDPRFAKEPSPLPSP